MLKNIPMQEETKETRTHGATLLNNFISGKIDRNEFYREVSYYALMYGFDELVFTQLPQKPLKLMDYDGMSDKYKSRIAPEFWLEAEVYKYMAEKREALNRNSANKWWLGELLKRFEYFKDEVACAKVKERLNGV